MHIDYAKESAEKVISSGYSETAAVRTIAVDEIVDLAAKVGSDKVKSIAETMKKSKGYRRVTGHKKITMAQQQAVADFLIAQYGTAEKVIEAAYS